MGSMDNFNYLAVLISIILGLGITQLLSGFGRWVESRIAFPAYAPTMLWAANLLLMHVQTWWAMYGLRFHTDWTFLEFIVVLLQPIALFLLAAVVLPSSTAAELDLKANYYTQRRWFFGLLVALLVVSLTRDIVLTGSLPDTGNVLFHGLFLVLSVCGWITARETYHRLMAWFSIAAIQAYVAVLFSQLR